MVQEWSDERIDREIEIEAIDDLKYFVAVFFDGSVQRCLELDELLWRVRLANRHEPKTWGPLPPPAPSPDEILKDLEL